LGLSGASARNKDGMCVLHGSFDVWLTEKNSLLITDLGFPSDDPKKCLALGVNEALAREIAKKEALQLKTSILTSERRCSNCQRSYWVSEHDRSPGLFEIGAGNLCRDCINRKSVEVEERHGVQRYWCG